MMHIRLTRVCELGRHPGPSADCQPEAHDAPAATEGNLASVHMVTDEQGREWALKQLRPGMTDPKVVDQFRSAARTMARLSHPGIVPVVAAALEGDRPFYVMPLASATLADDVNQNGAMKSMRLLQVAPTLIAGLRYAHEQKLLHRDLRPQKILRIGGKYRIADFGLSGRETESAASGESPDPAWFQAPERSTPKEFDERGDVYALGRVLLYCLTGGTPDEIPQTVSRPWRYIIEHCIQDKKEDRWSSAGVLWQQFQLAFPASAEPLLNDGPLRWFADLAISEREVTAQDIAQLRDLVAAAVADDVLSRRILFSLTKRIVSAWATFDVASLRAFIQHCEGTMSAAEDLASCDLIADQYHMIFVQTRDPAIRDAIRERLFTMGPSHNRRHIGQVFASLLTSVRGPAEVAHVISLARTDRASAAWNATYCGRYDIDKRIRDALAGVRTAGWR